MCPGLFTQNERITCGKKIIYNIAPYIQSIKFMPVLNAIGDVGDV